MNFISFLPDESHNILMRLTKVWQLFVNSHSVGGTAPFNKSVVKIMMDSDTRGPASTIMNVILHTFNRRLRFSSLILPSKNNITQVDVPIHDNKEVFIHNLVYDINYNIPTYRVNGIIIMLTQFATLLSRKG